MSKFESSVKVIPYPQEKVYAKISDLNSFGNLKDKLPADKVQDVSFDSDMLSFTIVPVGKIALKIIEREPYKTVKLEAVNSPIPFFLWIQLVEVTDTESKMKLTVDAELNPFIKGMVQKPLQEGLEKIAEALSLATY